MEFKPFGAGRPLERTPPPPLSDADRKVLREGGKIHFERIGNRLFKTVQPPDAAQKRQAGLHEIYRKWVAPNADARMLELLEIKRRWL